MTPNHPHFEVLCALAASGQLNRAELAELHEHCEGCSSCSGRLVEMTQAGAELFCTYLVNQPGIRMPKGMLERFIARAKSEGVPLKPRTESIGFTGPAWTAAFLLALLLVSTTLHFGFPTGSTEETTQGNTASVPTSIGDKGEGAPGALGNIVPDETRASRNVSRRKTSANGRKIPLAVSRSSGHGPLSRVAPDGLEQGQFDLTEYSRNLAFSHRPFFGTAQLDQDLQRAPARNGTPRFHLAAPLEFAEEDPLSLLAEYENRTVAPWSPQGSLASGPADAQALRRDFDPIAYRTLLNPDFKKNLPVFQFSPNARQ